MAEVQQLTDFYSATRNDPRIGATHISVYMALFQFYNLNNFQNPIQIKRTLVMEAAKINGLATFHKCIKDLHEYGYIQYIPSYNPAINSLVFMLNIGE